MSIDFEAAAKAAESATSFGAGGSGGAPLTEGKYATKIVEIKQEKTQNGFIQVHLMCEVADVIEYNDFDGSYPTPKVGDKFTAKFNVDTSNEKIAKAAAGNVPQLFALALWNGLTIDTFNTAKMKANFAKEYSYHCQDSIDEKGGWTCIVERVRGNAAQKGHYWNHGLSKAESANAKAGVDKVPQADEDDDLA